MLEHNGATADTTTLLPADPAGPLDHAWALNHQAALLSERLPDARDDLLATEQPLKRVAYATGFH